MKLLFVSNLFPNAAEPTRGVFNAQQAVALRNHCDIKVVAPMHRPVPDETWNDIPVIHPHFMRIPLISRPLNGWLFARAVEPVLRRERFDMVLVNWAYPDAFGVMLVAEKLKFPFATTVQGSDVNVLLQNPARKRQILRALRASRAVFCRSEALRETLSTEGIRAITVYNGIDRQRFHPIDRTNACRKLGLAPERRRVLYVGNLVPVKGPTILANAARQLPDVDIIFVGSGSEKIMAGRCVGPRPHDEIPLWMNACDLLCLPSLNEGLPNVALEAMACGLPVIASRVGGVPEIVRDGVNGLLTRAGDAAALAAALRQALTLRWDAMVIRKSVDAFDWGRNAAEVMRVLEPRGTV